MSRSANPDIGLITCPFTGEPSPVRRYRTGQRLAYFCSSAGQIKPNLEKGQLYIFENANFNDPEDKRQIGQWLESRGIRVQPGITPENTPDVVQDKPELHETIIGGSPEPIEDPVPEQTPAPTPAGSPSFLDRFLAGDEE